MKKPIIILILIANLTLSGCFPDYHVGYDRENKVVFSCNSTLGILSLSIHDEDSYELIQNIQKQKESKLSNKIFLEQENEGYDSDGISFRFEPLRNYKVSVYYGDVVVEMTLNTDSTGKVTKVTADGECSKL